MRARTRDLATTSPLSRPISRDLAPPCDPSPQTTPQSVMGFLCSYLKTTAAVDLPTPLYPPMPLFIPSHHTCLCAPSPQLSLRWTYPPTTYTHHTPSPHYRCGGPTPLLLHPLYGPASLLTTNHQACWRRGRRYTTTHCCLITHCYLLTTTGVLEEGAEMDYHTRVLPVSCSISSIP